MHQNFGDRWPEIIVNSGDEHELLSTGQVIALHCSGADGSQWHQLKEGLSPGIQLVTPDLFSGGHKEAWAGEHAFSLMDEARPIIEIIDALSVPVHLVGHSYGGGVALKVAMARPKRLTSVSLYEPSAFHLLRQLGDIGTKPLTEIENLAQCVAEGLLDGAYQRAATTFIDYWNGEGAWHRLKPSVKKALIRYLPKAALDFRALLVEDTALKAYRRIVCPVLLVRGEYAPQPSRLIVEALHRALPNVSLQIMHGAGHMGPFTHGAEVYSRIARHIDGALTRSVNGQQLALAA